MLIWALLLVMQNFAFTLVSRARNSRSYLFHGLAALLSNGVWFLCQFFMFDVITRLLQEPERDYLRLAGVGLFYTFFTIGGSLLSHWVSQRYLERRFDA